MNRVKKQLNQILSLRAPQKESLELLDKICSTLSLDSNDDLNSCLAKIRKEFPSFTSFEREFPSFCFALATGVGKTRLMGAFIAYLCLKEGIKNFFILAPNLTIYDKLIKDFTPYSDKYVLKGISEIAKNPPVVITGENFEQGIGVRNSTQLDFLGDDQIHINIFNIAKINSESKGDKIPRIKKLSEYLGESYFDYLSNLDDLVLLMDESHRYRASAGMRAINELDPILGLEFTATPFIEKANKQKYFENIIYSYPLSFAIRDGYVKEPAIGGRKDFHKNKYKEKRLEDIKLEDGIRIHEQTKVELDIYSKNEGAPYVKPFVLIVAEDTDHANYLYSKIDSDDFFNGSYKNKVIVVHSKLSGEVEDLTISKLLKVESSDNPIEIVIHVNKLKEGWDVKNLYTIIPLRAANAKNLLEQTVGRGLRLPYGQKTGNKAVDRLTIVSHDRFDELVKEANKPDSIIKQGVILGDDIPDDGIKSLTIEPKYSSKKRENFQTEEEQQIAVFVYDEIKKYEVLPNSKGLKDPSISNQITESLLKIMPQLDQSIVKATTKKAVEIYTELSIDIPKINVQPIENDQEVGFQDFNLKDLDRIAFQPVEREILIQHLQSHERYSLVFEKDLYEEAVLENYLVRGLIDQNDISIDLHWELLYKLSAQLVNHLKTYLPSKDLHNVLQYHQKSLVNFIYTQMQQHYKEPNVVYETKAAKGFTTLKPSSYAISKNAAINDLHDHLENKNLIKGLIFTGFEKCLYDFQKFDSNSERIFARILESDKTVLKWFKPAKGHLRIFYHKDHEYEPDFVIETLNKKYICEIKRSSDLKDEKVIQKAKAASAWCKRATKHAADHNDKPWEYLLIPHEEVTHNRSIANLSVYYVIK